MGKLENIEDKLDSILKDLEKTQGKTKKFKLPFLTTFLTGGKLRKQNYVITCFIRTNGAIQFKLIKIEDQVITVGENIYSATSADVLRYKKYPFMIIPEWDMQPFSPRKSFGEAVEKGRLAHTSGLVALKLEKDAIKPKMQLNFKTILIILAIGAGALYGLNYLGLI